MQQRLLFQIVLLPQHVSGTTMLIIRSSRVFYSGCCLWYFVLWFSSCWSGVELTFICPVCKLLLYLSKATSCKPSVTHYLPFLIFLLWGLILKSDGCETFFLIHMWNDISDRRSIINEVIRRGYFSIF
jgi:hypothetical protein